MIPINWSISDVSMLFPAADSMSKCLIKIRRIYDRFAALVEKYVDIPELTTTIVNEFVKKIIVHEADKSSGSRRQTVEIVFNFVGQIEIPILTEPITLEASPKQRKTA